MPALGTGGTWKPERIVTMKEDTDMPIVIKQKIPYTDFPLTSTKLYLVDEVLMFPAEYWGMQLKNYGLSWD
ncbi:hypothetical protein JW964_01240 [candidate division KSB1 bacterium]|nr:hypothetical protein [candidate division KSB1 bacterium]